MVGWLLPHLGPMSVSRPILLFPASSLVVAFDIRAIHDFLQRDSLSLSLLLPLADIVLTEAHEICRPSTQTKRSSYSVDAHIHQGGRVNLGHIPCTRHEVFMDKWYSLVQSQQSTVRFLSPCSYFRGCLRPTSKGRFPNSILYLEAQDCCSVMVWNVHNFNRFVRSPKGYCP